MTNEFWNGFIKTAGMSREARNAYWETQMKDLKKRFPSLSGLNLREKEISDAALKKKYQKYSDVHLDKMHRNAKTAWNGGSEKDGDLYDEIGMELYRRKYGHR